MLLILILFTFLIYLFYKYFTSNNDYWKNLGVPYEPSNFMFGALKDSIFMKKHVGETITDLYWKFKDVAYFGIMTVNQPRLVVKDAELIKRILIKDFANFQSNDINVNENDIFSKHPFSLTGNEWKVARSLQLQLFTPSKLKTLVPSMQIVGDRLVKYIEKASKVHGSLEAKDICTRFTVENVVNTSFGMEAHCFDHDGRSKFMKMIDDIFYPTFITHLKISCVFFIPQLIKVFDIRIFPKSTQDYFLKLVTELVSYRKLNNIRRNDFFDMLMDMQERNNKGNYDMLELLSHATSLFIDGTETSANCLASVLYEIANYPDVQTKLRMEIQNVIKKYNGELTYEAMQEMTYLDCVIQESLRIRPPDYEFSKICTENYNLPSPYKDGSGKSVTIKAGTPITIPVYGIHLDEKYYSEPHEFRPERFSEENKNSLTKCTYLVFGDGHRICLGQKFALMQIKVALACVLSNFELRVNEKTLLPLQPDPKYFMILYKGGLWLDFFKINNCD